jgi:hypothetical protein
VTGDEDLGLPVKPRSKTPNFWWKCPESSRHKKAQRSKQCWSAFMISQELPDANLFLQNRVNQAFCFQVLVCLCQLICWKGPNLWMVGKWVLHHDSVLSHSVLSVKHILAKENNVLTCTICAWFVPETKNLFRRVSF